MLELELEPDLLTKSLSPIENLGITNTVTNRIINEEPAGIGLATGELRIAPFPPPVPPQLALPIFRALAPPEVSSLPGCHPTPRAGAG